VHVGTDLTMRTWYEYASVALQEAVDIMQKYAAFGGDASESTRALLFGREAQEDEQAMKKLILVGWMQEL
jgi:hypothetical protein